MTADQLGGLSEPGSPGRNLLVLLIFAATVARRTIVVRFRDHLLLFVGAYLVAGAIQFTGVDAILWLVYGMHSGSSGATGNE